MQEGEQGHETDQRPATDEGGPEEQRAGTEAEDERRLRGELALGEAEVLVVGLGDVDRRCRRPTAAAGGEREAPLAVVEPVDRTWRRGPVASRRPRAAGTAALVGPSSLPPAPRAVLVVGVGHADRLRGRPPRTPATGDRRRRPVGPEATRTRRSPTFSAGGISHSAAPAPVVTPTRRAPTWLGGSGDRPGLVDARARGGGHGPGDRRASRRAAVGATGPGRGRPDGGRAGAPQVRSTQRWPVAGCPRRSPRRRAGRRRARVAASRSATAWVTQSSVAGRTGPDPSATPALPVGKSGGGRTAPAVEAPRPAGRRRRWPASDGGTPPSTRGRWGRCRSARARAARISSSAAARSGTLKVRWCGPGPWRARKRRRKSFAVGVVGHEELDPGPVPESELAGSEPDRLATRAPLGTEVDGVPVPDVLPAGDGVRDVVEHDAVDRWRCRVTGPDCSEPRCSLSKRRRLCRRGPRGDSGGLSAAAGRRYGRVRWTSAPSRWSGWRDRCARVSSARADAGRPRARADRRAQPDDQCLRRRGRRAGARAAAERGSTAGRRRSRTRDRWPGFRSGSRTSRTPRAS